MIKKRILIIGINNHPELTGIGKYTGEMIAWLIERGYSVTAISAFPYYPHWKIQSPYSGKTYKKEISQDGKLTLYRCPLYVPANPTGLKRLIHEATFFLSAFFIVCRLLFAKKFDLTVVIAPPFHMGFLGLFYRFFRRNKILYHIQDLQIDAAKELKILKPDWIFSILFAMEKFILNSVDFVSTISEGMKLKVIAKTKNKVYLFPNWVDTDAFFPIVESKKLKSRWNFRPQDKLVLYSGSIGEKQGLDSLIRIAKNIEISPDIKIIICGTGPFKNKLIEMAEAANLKNIFFLPLQETDVFNDFLNIADVHLVLQKGDASDLVMPSKLTTILSVGGLALVTADRGTSLGDVIANYEMGIVIPPEDEDLLREAIILCCSQNFSRERTNARKFAEINLNKDKVLESLLAEFT